MLDQIGNSIDESAAVEDLRFLEAALPTLQAIFDRSDQSTHVDFTECDIQDALEWAKSTIESIKDELASYERVVS